MSQLSAVIITYNEADFIGSCLGSIQGIADEIIVVDSFSSDSTEEICKLFNVRFVEHVFEGYIEQKNWGLTLASHKWILSLDADEALSEELRRSILEVKKDLNLMAIILTAETTIAANGSDFQDGIPTGI